MKKAIIVLVVLQALLNLYFWKTLPKKTDADAPPNILAEKKSTLLIDASAKPITQQEIYVYTVELDQDLKQLSHEVEKLKQQYHSDPTLVQEASRFNRKQPVSNQDFAAEIPYEASALKQVLTDFDQLDHNNNGKLETEEYEFQDQERKLLDLDANGTISSKELDKFFTFRENALAHAKQKDQNDGAFPISKSDYAGSPKRFEFIDHNSNGVITESEYVAFRKRAVVERRRLDLNKDGYLSFEEFGQSRLRFEKIDDNNDGQIQTYEIRTALYKGYW